MGNIPFAVTTPVSVSRVGLRARDAEKLAGYYRAVVGLQELSRADGAITLGAAGRPLLVIEADPAARPDDPRSAGLFHTAFLLPSRADLGRWVRHAIDRKIAIDGASDHLRQRGALPHRPGRQRHRNLCRPSARELEMERPVGRDGDAEARHPEPGRRGAGRRRRLEGRAGKQRHRPRPSAGSAIPTRPRHGGTTSSASTRSTRSAAAPPSCRPAATTTISAPIPGRAPGQGAAIRRGQG